jgi:hypothetical protein
MPSIDRQAADRRHLSSRSGPRAPRKRLAGALEGLMRAGEARSSDRRLADDDGPHPITDGARD